MAFRFVRKLFVIVVLSVFILLSDRSLAEDLIQSNEQCTEQYLDIPIQETEATAAFFANLRSSPGSLSYESEAIFNRAKDRLRELEAPEQFCKGNCKVRSIPFVYFKSNPKKLLSDYKDREYCQDLESKSTLSPIRYSRSGISSVKELVDWIGELAQGKGEEGRDLYARCDRSCSPRYEYQITKKDANDTTYFATVRVTCGPARDKSDNLYELHSFFRWKCVIAKTAQS